MSERFPDAGPEALTAARAREQREAENANEFKNCPTEVQTKEYVCAMNALSSEAVLKCLE